MKEEISNRELFNAEQKKEYMEYVKLNTDALQNYFERISYMERIYNKDIVDMNIEELKTTLLSLNIRSSATIFHAISFLRGYVAWAIYNGKTNNDNKIENLNPDDIKSSYAVRIQMIKDPEQIKDILINGQKKKNEDGHKNRVLRDSLILWLLYSGMTLKELTLLKKTDINYEKKIIFSPVKNNRYYSIYYDDILQLWDKCANIEYIEKTGKKLDESPKKYILLDNNYLFRQIAGKKTDQDKKITEHYLALQIINIFLEYFKETGAYLSVTALNLRTSGIYYRIYLSEKEGINVTPKMFCEYFGIECSEKEYSKKTRILRKDYKVWKDVFGYN